MNFWKELLDWMYPRRCPICDHILKNQKSNICVECVEKCVKIQQPKCMKCGKKLSAEEEEYCTDCRKYKRAFEQGIGIFEYNEQMKHSLMRYKYGGRREYVDFYADACVRYGKQMIQKWKIDGIIPIPISKSREKWRGFNQSAILAEKIGRELGIPVYEDALKKIKKTKNQKALDAEGRRKNLRGSFQGKEGNWKTKRILLIDDVYTTGSTINEAAGEIKKHGVDRVYFLTIFIGKGF